MTGFHHNRGKAAAGGGPAPLPAAGPCAVKAMPVALRHKHKLGEALALILANCVQQMQANAQGVVAGDAESLHQLRVGLRRLRAALDMARDVVVPPAPIGAELKWLAGELGTARNWDVFIASVLPDLLPDRNEDQDAQAIRAAAEDEAQRQRQQVRKAIESARYTTLMLDFGEWLAGRAWQAGADRGSLLARPVRRGARDLVRHAAARLRKRVRKLDLRDSACLHKVRIAAKKERYALEFFAAVRKDDSVRLGRLTRMQDELGVLNDAAIAHGLLEQLKQRVPHAAATLAYMEGVLAGGLASAQPRARKRVRKAFG